MTHHILKCDLPYFDAVESGDKTFEIRRNDRGYQKGDTISLCPAYEGSPWLFGDPVGLWEITYVTGFQQKEGFVVFGIKRPVEGTEARA